MSVMSSLRYYFIVTLCLILLCLLYYGIYTWNAAGAVQYKVLYTNTTIAPSLSVKTRETKLLTLFTTFTDKPEKFFVHRNVLLNWAGLSEKIQPVLFADLSANKSDIFKIALQYGWIVRPLPPSNSTRPPFFKALFRYAVRLTDSLFYGYCNADILFTEGLLRTLESISSHVKAFNSTLVIGRRTNVNINESSAVPFYKSKMIRDKARQSGRLFLSVAEDYFLISRPHLFPWHTLKDVVIGRPAYDNYVVAQAIRGNVSVVDATSTNLAVHQTGKDGNTAGAKMTDSRYNRNIIGRYSFVLGSTDRAQYATTMDFLGRVFLQKRNFARPKPKPKPKVSTKVTKKS